MGILDRLRTSTAGQLDTAEYLLESAAALLRREDKDWVSLGGDSDTDGMFTREALTESARSGRALVIAHPLIRRGVSLRTAYIHGNGGPQVTVEDNDTEQDVNAVVQDWWTSRENQTSLTGPEARARLERALATDGNVFIACFTNPRTGVVVNRTIPADEVTEVHTNPEDRSEVWFYRRTFNRRVSSRGVFGLRTQERSTTLLYPSLNYSPVSRPSTIDGVEVRWDEPVRHVRVNELDGWLWGIGDIHSVIVWARGYRDFVGDWMRLHRSLSQFAWRFSADGKRQNAARRALQQAAPTGSAMVHDIGESIEAIPKTGATIDADSGRPLMALIAAGLDVPVTMLSTDPGVTGARATAETLDEPMYLAMQSRRDVWAAVYRDIAEYQIEQAVRAPGGKLQGTVVRDPWTRTDHVEIDGYTPGVGVDWPDLSTTPTKELVDAIATADASRKLPPATVARLLLTALSVDDIDSVMEELTDDDGNWRDPYATAGSALVNAFNRGEDAAQALGQFGRFESTPAAEAAIRREV